MGNFTHSSFKKSFISLSVFLFTALGLFAQTVTTDKLDYIPGETAYASGSGWADGEAIVLNVHEEPVYHADVVTNIVADSLGNFTNVAIYNFEAHDYNSSFTLTATGQSSGNVAYAYFTDGGRDIWAWRNQPGPTLDSWDAGTTIQQANSVYAEGEVIPFVWTIESGNPAPQLTEGVSYMIELDWAYAGGTTGPEKLFIDYLTSYNVTESADVLFGPGSDLGTGFTGTYIKTVPIPNDNGDGAPNPTTVVHPAGDFTLYNIDPASVMFSSYISDPENANQEDRKLQITFKPSDGDATLGEDLNVGIAWGGHLASQIDYGFENGAADFPGASPQFVVFLDPDLSNALNPEEENQQSNINISPNAIVAQGQITIVKDAAPDDAQDFGFTITGPTGANITPTFILDDDGDPNNGTSNEVTFFGLVEGEYIITENSTAGWSLTSIVDDENGSEDTTTEDIFVGDVPTRTATVTVANGENWVVTYLNEVAAEPSLEIIKSLTNADDAIVDTAGETIEYTITVENTGNQDLTNVVLGDVFAGGATLTSGDDGDLILQTTETWVYTADYVVTQADLNAGTDLVNVASVVTTEVPGPTEDDATSTVDQTKSLEIVKVLTNAEDAVVDTAGEIIEYTITVENTGNVDLTNVVLTDTFASGATFVSGDDANVGVLDDDETWTYTAQYTVTQADLNAGTDLVNVASVVTTEVPGPTEDDATSTVDQMPAISIVKNGTFNDENNDGFADEGETISYTFAVTNEGNVTLTNVTVTDPLFTVNGGPTTLDVGETDTTTFTGTYEITQEDIDAGQRDNIATADSDESDPTDGPNTTDLPQNPDISIVKIFLDDEVIAGGAGSSFTLVVTNVGNVTLSDALIEDTVDPRLTVTDVSGPVGEDENADGNVQTIDWIISSLAPGDSKTITVYFEVAPDIAEANGVGDLNNEDNVPNSAMVTAEAPQGDTGDPNDDITDDGADSIDILVDIDLTIVKTFDPATIKAPQGTLQEFTIVVSNAGPSDAVDVSVTDTVDDLLEVVYGPNGINVTEFDIPNDNVDCTDSEGNIIDCTILRIPAGGSETITVEYMTAPFLDDPSPYITTTAGGDDFYFKFLNGSVLEGTTRGDGLVLLDGVPITGDVTIVRGLTRNDIVFDPPGPAPAFTMHLSCSDPFTGGWGQSAGPVEGVDDNWQIAFFTIARFNNNGFIKSCGNVVNPFDVMNIANSSGDDSFGRQDVSDDAMVTIGPGIIINRLQTNGKRLTVRLNNLTAENKLIRDIEALWPDGNGDLKKIWLTYGSTSDVIWQGSENPSDVFLDDEDPGWIGGTLFTGEAILRFDFKNKVKSSPYVIRVSFTDGTWLDISIGGEESQRASSTAESTTVDVTDTSETPLDVTTVEAYPLPFGKELNVQIEIAYEAIVNVQLFDMDGRLVLNLGNHPVVPGTNLLEFRIDGRIPEAILILKVDTGKEIISKTVLSRK